MRPGVGADARRRRSSSGRRSARGSRRSACRGRARHRRRRPASGRRRRPRRAGATSSGATKRLVSTASSRSEMPGSGRAQLGGVRRDDRLLVGCRPVTLDDPQPDARREREVRGVQPLGQAGAHRRTGRRRARSRRTSGSPQSRTGTADDPRVREEDRHADDARNQRLPPPPPQVPNLWPPGPASSALKSHRRAHSIAGQVSITIGTPAATVRSKAASSMTPSWNHTARAPIATAWSANSPAELRAPEDVDDVDGERHVGERRVALRAQHDGGVGVDGDDPLAALLEHARDPVRRAVGVAGEPDHRPGLCSRRA